MRAPAFYWKRPGITANLLAPLGLLYGTAATARLRLRGEAAPIPVVCIGNPTLGGAGKTPTALAIAHLLRELGARPFIVSRGYGGRERGPLAVDAKGHDAAMVGDEPLLLARQFPTIVARDRTAGVRYASERAANVAVLDDGFQSPSPAKDLSLLVIDGRVGVGNGRVFPAGPLRAPLIQQIDRAAAIVIVGDGDAGKRLAEAARGRGVTVFGARLMPDDEAARLKGRKVLAFAGIGHPEKFFSTLAACGAEIALSHAYDDHHAYSAAEARSLLETASSRGLRLVTTEKDLVRLRGDPALAALAEAATALPVRLVFDDEDPVKRLLAQVLVSSRAG